MNKDNYRNNLNQRVPFEYTTVSKFTRCPELYITTFKIELDRERTEEIIEHLCKKYNVSFKKMILHLKDRPDERSYGGVKRIKGKRVPYMSMAMDNGKTNAWEVCHEFAHALFYNRYKQLKKQHSDMNVHGRCFTFLLDRIITHFSEQFLFKVVEKGDHIQWEDDSEINGDDKPFVHTAIITSIIGVIVNYEYWMVGQKCKGFFTIEDEFHAEIIHVEKADTKIAANR